MKIKSFVNQKDFSCNVYICSDEKNTFIVDLGYFDSEIEEYLKSVPPVKFVLQTHCHFDHIRGLNAFAQKFPEVDFYCHKEEVEIAYDYEKNASFMTGSEFRPNVIFKTLEEGDTNIHGLQIKVIHTPGHTAGSCMFYFEKDNVIFTGDTLIESSIGRTDLPTGSETEIYKSLKKMQKINFDEDTEFFFGHGTPFYFRDIVRYNPFFSR